MLTAALATALRLRGVVLPVALGVPSEDVIGVAWETGARSCGDRDDGRFLRGPVVVAGGVAVALGVCRRCRWGECAARASLRLLSCRCLLILLPPIP